MIPSVTQRTFYFVGVTTGQSSIMRIFPRWMDILGIDCAIAGIDAPLNAPSETYREIIAHIKGDPLVVGGLVTAHKISLLNAARDLFDELDDLAALAGEVSGIGKRGDKLIGFARDPISSRLALDAFVPPDHFAQTGSDVLCFGSGGAAVAIGIALAHGSDHPRRMILTDIDSERLDHARAIHEQLNTGIDFEYILNSDPAVNAALMRDLPPGSLVINGTGMGKDLPGSPLPDGAPFPDGGLAWELNYRGELTFLKQAQSARLGAVEDGWTYFVHGWTQVVAGVFDLQLTPDLFRRMDDAAKR